MITADKREVRAAVRAELRAVRAEGKAPVLEGYAAVYDQKSEPIYGMWYEIVRRGAFARALAGEDDVRALFDHDAAFVLGRTRSKTLRLSDDAHGLKVSIDLPDTQQARDLATLVERGDVNQMSFGFRTLKDRWTIDREAKDGIAETRELLEVELFDVSVVTYPAYPQTEVGVRGVRDSDPGMASREAWRQSLARTRLRNAQLRLAELDA